MSMVGDGLVYGPDNADDGHAVGMPGSKPGPSSPTIRKTQPNPPMHKSTLKKGFRSKRR